MGLVWRVSLVNLPPNLATPTRLAEEAEAIARQFNLGLTIGDRAWMAEHKMGALLAVAQGAGEPPKFIVLEHNGGRSDLETVVLVGKGSPSTPAGFRSSRLRTWGR